ncbi:MAG: opacity protein-like surface antigen [Lentimonas sp.]|jgi:opacity protein-like surface antigen
MLNKKLLAVASVAAVLSSSMAFAKNDGGHVVSLEGSFIDVDQNLGNADYLGSDNQILPTLRYGYKFQFDKIFVRPSASYTIGDIDINDTDGTSDKSTVSNIYTIESDIGYDITDAIGVFGTLGLQGLSLEREVSGSKDDANSIGFLLGLGAEYNINDNLSVSAKYQYSEVNVDVQGSNSDHELELNTIKIGFSYNF